MSKVGFIGLGTMGAPMAKNLLQAGHELTVFARRDEVRQEFTAAGAKLAETPADVARAADVIITIVTADAQVEEVTCGPSGVVEGASAGKVLIDMSTIGPDTTCRVGAKLAETGMQMLDAPVSGGPWGAEAGTLTIMVGGADEVFEKCRPILDAMGKNIVHLGPLGAGQTVKLINQMMGAGIMALAGEGFVMAKRAGVNLDRFADVVETSSGNSAVFQARGKKFVLANDYDAKFRCDLMHKDILLAVELAQQMGVPVPLGSAALQQYMAALNQGHGGEDFAAVVKTCESAAGVKIVE